ncbi:hypothetical protein TNCT_378671, partial [Trichonephila clavata]
DSLRYLIYCFCYPLNLKLRIKSLVFQRSCLKLVLKASHRYPLLEITWR